MKRAVAAVVLMLLIPALFAPWVFGLPQDSAPTITASVVDVISIDTVEVEIIAVTGMAPVWEGDHVMVRMIGIEATQSAEAFWDANASFYSTMIVGKTVYLAVDAASVSFWNGGDEPLLAYVYLDPDGKTLVNSLLVSMGFAEAATGAQATAAAEATATSSSEVQQTIDQQTVTTAAPQAEAASEAMAEVSSEVVTPQTVPAPASVSAAAIVPGPGFGCCCLNACVCEQLVSVLCLTSHVRRGDYAKLQVQTVPDAWCKIDVRYHSGLTTDLDLSPRSAFCGVVTWRWRVTADTPPGTWPVVVTARLNGEIIGRLETSITVHL